MVRTGILRKKCRIEFPDEIVIIPGHVGLSKAVLDEGRQILHAGVFRHHTGCLSVFAKKARLLKNV